MEKIENLITDVQSKLKDIFEKELIKIKFNKQFNKYSPEYINHRINKIIRNLSERNSREK